MASCCSANFWRKKIRTLLTLIPGVDPFPARYERTHSAAEAHAQYLQLAAQEPKNPIIQNNLAWVLARLSRWQEALPYARSAAACSRRVYRRSAGEG